jgi:hypothetical protein
MGQVTESELPGETSLYMLEDRTGAGTASLADLPLKLYLRLPPHYLVATPTTARRSLESRGFSVRPIGRVLFGETLYLLSRPEESRGPDPSAGEILYRGDGWFLVKGDEEVERRFGPEGFHYTIVSLRPLPLEVRTGRLSMPRGIPKLSPDLREKAASSDSVITEYLQRLEAFQTRYTWSDSVAASAEWIHDRFLDMGFTDVAYDSFWYGGTWQRNVVATKPGSVNPDKVIVIGGHYDSVTYDGGCDPMTWAPGVDDDGSGTVMTMELARLLAGEENEVTLTFVAFAAEEQGLHGSWHFAQEAFDSGMDIQLMINMDMIGNVSDGVPDVDINTDNPSMSYAELMRDVALDSTTLQPRISISGSGSDHWPFMQLGYNHVYVEEGDFSPHWHRCTDTFENVDVPYMVQVREMILPTIVLVANAPSEPTGFTAHDVGDGESFRLEWDPNPEPDIRGYLVYTGPDEENMAVIDPAEGVATDPLPIVPLVRPRPPVVLDITSRTDEIEMAWQDNTELDLDGYIVYRKERGEPVFLPIATLTKLETSFIDGTADPSAYYLYQITAVDDGGVESDPSSELRGRLATHDSGILVVDATKDGTGGLFSPTDEAVDDFYDEILQGYDLTASWDYADSVTVGRRPVDADLGIYSTVVWHRDDRFGEEIAPDTPQMAKFLDTGGNLFLSGWAFLSNLSDGVTEFSPGSFFYDYLKIDGYATTGSGEMDFVGADAAVGDYSDVAIDPEKVLLEGLFQLDYLEGPPVAGREIYTYSASEPTSPFQGVGMGGEYIGGEFGVVVLHFPLFYIDALDAKGLMETAMSAFGESPAIVGDDGVGGDVGLPKAFALGQNYPNPFNPSTTIAFAIPAGRETVKTRVAVFDVRGRRVRTLVDSEKEPGYYRVHWDGRDDRGARVGSGVYIYTIDAGDFRATRKMVLTR